MNKLLLGDNLQILKNLESELVDLIYLDPPFFSNRNYEVIWGDKGEIRSFEDRWSGGIDHYIAWLKERVEEMHRILKSTGSIFLHCDWHADAYIRVFILDKIFGENNFRNEIIWRYKRWPAKQKNFQRMHDNILFYTKSAGQITFNLLYDELSEGTKKRWKGKKSLVEFQEGKRLVTKMTDDDSSGRLMDDVWDIAVINSQAKERIGYPTQKPEALLERIILCASNENDVILDPFVGGGTTVAVADKLKRQWIGIDQSVQAIKVSELRLQKQQDLFSKPFTVQLHKYDYDTLRYSNAFEFESWIIQQYGGVSNIKQRSDLGIDGKTRDGVPIQVKRSDNIGRNVIDNFKSACERFDSGKFNENKAAKNLIGIIIAFSFGKGAIQEVARLKNQDNLIIELITVEQIIPIAKKPKLTVTFNDLGLDNKELREIEFIAAGE
ncbi:DNA-methyltransferase [Thioflexithrix psekupsensis]|uniref:Methyltransferase n=1 Tax=Thioflexithrix psekupsensis TaxID=1570016 RepID=A0A251X4P5_9GAMM|nr:site-specific DNA-methyltransferase [Thioflexithrix psekupsensis]OUD12169.1 hypothetical protein TPSD3_13670 [Thioflexithrix psekupsensis]